jgi:hypothetical protein
VHRGASHAGQHARVLRARGSVTLFRRSVSNLKNATKQLLANRGEFRDSDLADLLVSECAATIRTVGTSTEIPVCGTSPGTA